MEIQKWREILSPYELAVDELRIKFNYIIKQNKAATVLIVLVPVVIKVVDTIVPIAPVRLIITRMQSIV